MAIRALLVAVIAAICASSPMIVLLTLDMDANLMFAAVPGLFLLALVGSLVIGLPIALLIFKLIRNDAEFRLGKLFLVANGVAIGLLLVVTAFSGTFGAIFFGAPIVIAANAFALAGWLLILKPARANA